MKDIGLGILDRYTVLITIIVLALANSAFGLSLPLDTSNATQLILSLVIFTGYLYLARTLVRLPVALFSAIVAVRELHKGPSFYLRSSGGLHPWFKNLLEEVVYFFVSWFIILKFIAVHTINFSAPQLDIAVRSKRLEKIKQNRWVINLLAVFDRLSVVFIATLAMYDVTRPWVQILGVYGAALLLVLFLFRGNFSALLEDELARDMQKAEKDEEQPSTDEESREAPKNQNVEVQGEEVYRLGIATIKVTACENCGRQCADNQSGKLPRFCSLKCQQAWYPTWERDWCIGIGWERQLVEGLREVGYDDKKMLRKAVDELKAGIFQSYNDKSYWALFGMVRDINAGSDESRRYELVDVINEAFESIIKEKGYSSQLLMLLLLDKDEALVLFALEFLQKYPHDSLRYNNINARVLLKHPSWRVRNGVIPLLGTMQCFDDLFAHIGIGETFETLNVLRNLALKDSPSIYHLLVAQRHPLEYVRRDATEMLFNLGKNPKIPSTIERTIECPNEECRIPLTITHSAYSVFQGVKSINLFNRRKYKVKTRCSRCGTHIGVQLDENNEDLMRLRNEEWFEELKDRYSKNLVEHSSVNSQSVQHESDLFEPIPGRDDYI